MTLIQQHLTILYAGGPCAIAVSSGYDMLRKSVCSSSRTKIGFWAVVCPVKRCIISPLDLFCSPRLICYLINRPRGTRRTFIWKQCTRKFWHIYSHIYSFTFHGLSRPMHKWVLFHTSLVGVREKQIPDTFYVRGGIRRVGGGLLCFQRGAEHRNCDISVVSRMLSSVICVSLRVGSVQLR